VTNNYYKVTQLTDGTIDGHGRILSDDLAYLPFDDTDPISTGIAFRKAQECAALNPRTCVSVWRTPSVPGEWAHIPVVGALFKTDAWRAEASA
jgi:hypothetical protein